jgi:hypothetical protein
MVDYRQLGRQRNSFRPTPFLLEHCWNARKKKGLADDCKPFF